MERQLGGRMISINFGTPQLLLLMSLIIFPQSTGFSIALFILGLLSAMAVFSIEYTKKEEKLKQNKKITENLEENLKNLLTVAFSDDKKSFH